jgi:hypothetical protein
MVVRVIVGAKLGGAPVDLKAHALHRRFLVAGAVHASRVDRVRPVRGDAHHEHAAFGRSSDGAPGLPDDTPLRDYAPGAHEAELVAAAFSTTNSRAEQSSAKSARALVSVGE